MRKVLEIDNNEIRKKKETIKMAKVKTFKTIFPAVSVPLNDDYSINEPEFRAYLRWIKTFYGKGMDRKRRCLFFMERTQTEEISTTSF